MPAFREALVSLVNTPFSSNFPLYFSRSAPSLIARDLSFSITFQLLHLGGKMAK
jgi:hypothetical protein